MSESSGKKKKRIAWSLWIPVVLAFLLVICAWTTLIQIVKENPVKQIEIKSNESE